MSAADTAYLVLVIVSFLLFGAVLAGVANWSGKKG